MAERTDLSSMLRRCCGSETWVRAVIDACHGDPDADVLDAADVAWSTLDGDAWRDVFAADAAAVPPLGDAGTRDAARVALDLYTQRFGYSFVTAGSTSAADELLMRVRIRLGNEPQAEWRIACDEARRATRLRLESLLRSAS